MKNKRNTSKEKQKRNKGFPYRLSSLFGKKQEPKPRKSFPKCPLCKKAMRDESDIAYYKTLRYHSECLGRKKGIDSMRTESDRRRAALWVIHHNNEKRNETKRNN